MAELALHLGVPGLLSLLLTPPETLLHRRQTLPLCNYLLLCPSDLFGVKDLKAFSIMKCCLHPISHPSPTWQTIFKGFHVCTWRLSGGGRKVPQLNDMPCDPMSLEMHG